MVIPVTMPPVTIAVPVAVVPPPGAVPNVTVGTPVYPDGLDVMITLVTTPLVRVVIADALLLKPPEPALLKSPFIGIEVFTFKIVSLVQFSNPVLVAFTL